MVTKPASLREGYRKNSKLSVGQRTARSLGHTINQIRHGHRVIAQDFQQWGLFVSPSADPEEMQRLTDILGYHPTTCNYGTEPWEGK